MLAMSFGAQATAMYADCGSSMRMPSSMPARKATRKAMPMGACAAAASESIFTRTGVSTSVSLFVPFILVPLLPVGLLVVLISLGLALTRLTGLVGLRSLVGQNNELAARTIPGD